jgi:taurine dioxygenase
MTDVRDNTTAGSEAPALEIKRLSQALGAEITSIDLSVLSDSGVELIKDLLVEHKVLFFPGQNLSMREHVELGHRFGHLEGHPNLGNPYPDHPEVFELAATRGGIADEWHSDLTFQESPSVMSVLKMVKCPELGGETMWTNLEMAYAELSAPLRDLVDGLTALHDAAAHGKPEMQHVHPVVRVHPVSGRRSLYVNEHFTRRLVELSQPESEMLLPYLTRWVHNEEFTVRYRWSEDTIAMWDNRSTQHFVFNNVEEERVVQRVTVMGDHVEGNVRKWPVFARGIGASSRLDRVVEKYFLAHPDEA